MKSSVPEVPLFQVRFPVCAVPHAFGTSVRIVLFDPWNRTTNVAVAVFEIITVELSAAEREETFQPVELRLKVPL